VCRIGLARFDNLIERVGWQERPKETPVKYLCLVYLSSEKWNACSDSSCAAYAGQLKDSGKLLDGSPLHPVDTATTVRVRNGQTTITDGPFAETKEALAGFYLIEARDLNEAIQIASKIPPAKYGSIEVRPTRELVVDQGEVERFAAAAGP
jgi:hypothetical protein